MSGSRTRAASEKSTHTRVTSTSGLKFSGADEMSIRPSAAKIAPTATKTIGAVRSARSSRAEIRPHAKIVAATTTTAVTLKPGSRTPLPLHFEDDHRLTSRIGHGAGAARESALPTA